MKKLFAAAAGALLIAGVASAATSYAALQRGVAAKTSVKTPLTPQVKAPAYAEAEGIVPPHIFTFESDLEGFTSVDANGDNNTWKYSSSQAYLATFSSTDDWLISPPIKMVGGRTYTISMDAKGLSKSYEEKFEVKAGTSAFATSLNTVVIDVKAIKSQTYETFSGEFTAPISGDYYFGVHGMSKDGMFGIYVDNFSISAPAAAPAVPAQVQNVTFSEGATPGEVTVSWDAVTKDNDGADLDPASVSYGVYLLGSKDMTLLSEVTSGTTYTYQAVPEGAQKFVQYAVVAVNAVGEGAGNVSDFGPVGTPYKSFSLTRESDLDRYILGVNVEGGVTAGVYGDDTYEDLASYDGDDFYLGFYGTSAEAWGSVFTGKIDLAGMINPTFSYYIYNLALDGGYAYANEVITEVTDVATGVTSHASTVVAGQSGPAESWNRVAVDLSAFEGKVITINLKAVLKTAQFTFVDNLNVGSVVDYDLQADAVMAPVNVLAGKDIDAQVIVKNIGAKQISAYTVSLYAGGSLVEARTCTDIAAGATVALDFTVATSVLDTDPVELYATVSTEGDAVQTNDRTSTVSVLVVAPEFPVVTDLHASCGYTGVELAWSEPDLSQAPSEPITESFEDGDAFADEFGEWTFVDVDKTPVGGISIHDIPGITPGTTMGAFWIWDSTLLNDPLTGPHSGKKFLFSLFRYDDKDTDKWAISPELCGKAQTIRFYAKSYTTRNLDRIEVYYSTTGTALEDFVQILKRQAVMPYWEEYNVELPEGAKYFAIRSCATAGYMLAIDDVTFTPAGNANLDLAGYNVYRDGVKLNDAVVEEPEYTDETAVEGASYTYHVTTVYTKGESAASNAAAITFNKAGVVSAEASAVAVAAAGTSVTITGADGLVATLYAPDGTAVAKRVCGPATTMTASAGFYILAVDGKAYRLYLH